MTLVSMYCYSMYGAMHFHTEWDVLIFEQLSGMCRQLLNGTLWKFDKGLHGVF